MLSILIQKRNWACTFCTITFKPLNVDAWIFHYWKNYTAFYISIHFRMKVTKSFVIMTRKTTTRLSRLRRFSVNFQNSILTIFFNVLTANNKSHLICICHKVNLSQLQQNQWFAIYSTWQATNTSTLKRVTSKPLPFGFAAAVTDLPDGKWKSNVTFC